MGFLKKIKKFALPAIGFAVGGPIGAAIGSGVSSYTDNHNIGSALLSAGAGYVGGNIGSSIGSSLGTVGGALGTTAANTIGPAYSSTVGGVLGGEAGGLAGAAGNVGIGALIGGYTGSELAQNSLSPTQQSSAPAGPTPFSPTQDAQKDLPASLLGLGSLTSEQQSTNLANQGTYGGGLGNEENQYFLNQINRRLVDQSGNTSDYHTALQPIEQSYLQKLGFGGYDNSSNLLEAISKWQNQAA